MEHLSKCIVCGSLSIEPWQKHSFLYICSVCGMIFDNPRPTIEQIKVYYSGETQYDYWLSDLKGRNQLWQSRLKIVLSHKLAGRLLDIGSGIGEFLSVAQKHFEVLGTEVSDSAMRHAQEKFGIRLIAGTIESIDFGDLKFDIITAFHVLEHVHDPKYFVNKCFELLTVGGYCIVAIPNEIDSLVQRIRVAYYRLSGKTTDVLHYLSKIDLSVRDREIHLSHFTERTISFLLQEAGFKIVKIGLDRHHGLSGFRRTLRNALFSIFAVLRAVSGRNWYDTILVVAKKP